MVLLHNRYHQAMVIHQPLLKKCHQLIPPNRQLPHHKRHHLANHLVVIVMCTVSHHPHPCLRHHHHQQSHQLLFQNPPHKENLDRPQWSLGQLVQNPSINRHIHRPHPQGEGKLKTIVLKSNPFWHFLFFKWSQVAWLLPVTVVFGLKHPSWLSLILRLKLD